MRTMLLGRRDTRWQESDAAFGLGAGVRLLGDHPRRDCPDESFAAGCRSERGPVSSKPVKAATPASLDPARTHPMMLSGQGAVRMRWGTDASGRRPPYLTRLTSR